MAANLNVSYEAMESEASALVSGKEEITQKLSALKTRIDNLVSNGFVTDQASGAFNEMYQNFTTSASNTISSLDGIANGLRSWQTPCARPTPRWRARSAADPFPRRRRLPCPWLHATSCEQPASLLSQSKIGPTSRDRLSSKNPG